MLPLEKVSFNLVGLHEVSISHCLDVQVQVTSDTEIMGHKKFSYLFIITAESLQLCYTNHPVVVVGIIFVIVDRC